MPRPPEPPRTIRERVGALRNLRPFLKLVWQTSPPITLAIAVLRLVRAVLGDSIIALRVTPLTCGVLQVVLSGVLAHRLGARAIGARGASPPRGSAFRPR